MKMKVFYSALCAFCLLFAVPAAGGDAPSDIMSALDKAGVPVYPGAVFCTGTMDVGIRFATNDSPEKVRQWYRDQRPAWQLFENASFGDIWVLYEGPQKIAMMEWMKYNMATVGTNEQVPSWHSLPKDMTTEIILGVADNFK